MMGNLIKKLKLKSSKSKFVILLASLSVFSVIIGKGVNRISQAEPTVYSSLKKAEEACIGWQQTGDLHRSLTRENARQTYGYYVGQGSCDFVIPSLGRRFSEQMNGKELVLSRLCVNDKVNNTILGKRNDVMENGDWINRKNEGTYETVTTFRY